MWKVAYATKNKKKSKCRAPGSQTFEIWCASCTRYRSLADVALRDGHQSLLATRMRTEDLLSVGAELDEVGFWSLEVWGGATFDSCLRFLKEDPWERLRAFTREVH
jgi:pyruvate carboxylase subunit B